MEILTVENLTFSYPQDGMALDGVSFSAAQGDFIAVCGTTGCGKSTLLRCIKRELTPRGVLSGTLLYGGAPLSALSDRESAAKIGYVSQHPEQQTVTDLVWHELAFGLENLGEEPDVIRRRVAETASFFGIEDWFDKRVSTLSGGQKQLLSLASVMVMQPEILLLDEPTSQLDPIAAADFIAAVVRLNRELSLTVLIAEHRLEEVIPASDKLLVLRDGRVLAFGSVRETAASLSGTASEGMPAAVRLFSGLRAGVCPLTVREGRDYIRNNYKNTVRSLPEAEYRHQPTEALKFSDVFFRYGRDLPDVLHGLSFTVYSREIFCLLGGNGSGKSTALAAAAGLLKPYSGSISVFGKRLKAPGGVSMLPQDVQTVFLYNTVREELQDSHVDPADLPFDLSGLADRHPYDLSGGQQQLLALAKVLAAKSKLLLLDEPTKGLDAHTKTVLIGILKKLRDDGLTVICVTHDVEFAALCADRCALFFRGETVSCDTPRRFFDGNAYYTTAANRMVRGYYSLVSTVDDALALCLANGRKP